MAGDTRPPNRRRRPGYRRQAVGCVSGIVVALVAGTPLCLTWLGLAWLGVGVPTPGDPTEAGVAVGFTPLIVSTVLALLTALSVLPVMFFLGMAHDSVHGETPWRTNAFVLCYVLPVLALVTATGAWVCYGLGDGDAARYLGLGPWGAAVGMVGTVAVVYSGAVAYSD
jgi:hypothetical protein